MENFRLMFCSNYDVDSKFQHDLLLSCEAELRITHEAITGRCSMRLIRITVLSCICQD